jgi:hypothetical protein
MRTKQTPNMRHRRTICIAGMGAMLSVGLMALWPCRGVAQAPDQTNNPVRVGDWWTYDQRDEITGTPTTTFTHTVTDISPTEFVLRLTNQGKNGASIRVYDHDWNLTDRGDYKYKPSMGGGVKPPLAVGKEWHSEHESRSASGYVGKGSVTRKVTAQESITTPAGTFETFKIESLRREINAADPSKSQEYQDTEWYAPQINYWARRLIVARVQKRVIANTSEELVSFGRRQ